jgi:hypothetical protein
MEFRRRTLKQIADLVCGNEPDASKFFVYRSSSYLTEFVEEIDREEFVHDGSTRQWWVADVLGPDLERAVSSGQRTAGKLRAGYRSPHGPGRQPQRGERST